MKLYCELCSKTQPVRIDNCRDAKTNEPYQDIVCAECDLVIASGMDIAQPEQEPVAWMDKDGDVLSASIVDGTGLRNIPLYTAPPKREWVGLTDESIWDIKMKGRDLECVSRSALMRFAREIEAASKEKNT